MTVEDGTPRRSKAQRHAHNWKGGRVVDPRGYVLIYRPEHHHADIRGYVYEHVLVAEATIGRRILKGEQVHHKDENKSNNTPANLEVLTAAMHHFRHRTAANKDRLRYPGAPNPEVQCACGCGESFLKFDGAGRPRRFVTGHNLRTMR